VKPTFTILLALCLCLTGCREKPQTLTLKEKAEGGDAEAQSMLGFDYETGLGGEKQDPKEAVKWYQKAAEQGFAEAQHNLGFMYIEGRGVEQDSKEAVKWFRKAAEQGDESGQKWLGMMYAFGDGVEKNYVTAYAWVNIAAANDAAKGVDEDWLEDKIVKKMTPDQIAKAEELSKEMIKKNPKLIKK